MATTQGKNENIKLISKWSMYEHYQDITNATKNAPYGGSLNVMVNELEKIVPRGGMRYIYNESSVLPDSFGIVGEFDKFFGVNGEKIPIKIFQKENTFEVYALLKRDNGLRQYFKIGTISGNSKNKFTFATWFDKDADQSILVFCNGGNSIHTWSGAYAEVTHTGTSLSTVDGKTFFQKGFNSSLAVIETQIVDLMTDVQFGTQSNLNSSTITVTSNNAGAPLNRFVAQGITSFEPDGFGGKFSFDYCAQLYNQIYYGDFSSRRIRISNDKNSQYVINSPIFTNGSALSDGVNDLSVSGTFTGTKDGLYKIKIIHAKDDTYTFTGSNLSVDDTRIDTSNYTLNTENTYKVVITNKAFNEAMIMKNGVFFNAIQYNPFLATIVFDGIELKFGATTKNDGDKWEVYVGGPDKFSVEYNNNSIIQSTDITPGQTVMLPDGVRISFADKKGHYLGDYWLIQAYPEIKNGFANFYYSVENRLPGQGFELLVDSPFFTMHPQEKDMYIYCNGGHQYMVFPTLSANLATERIQILRLKSDEQNIPKDPWLVGVFKNMLTTLARDNTIEVIGRQSAVELPQIKVMTDKIKYDLNKYDFTGGSIKYINRNLYITAPKENLIFIWDDANKGWQPPQRMARPIGLISFIDNKIIGHDYYSRNSYELFTTSLTDLANESEPFGIAIQKRLVLPYNNFGERMMIKHTNMIGFEGYMNGEPEISYTINYGINMFNNSFKSKIFPVYEINDTALNGQGATGSHQNASDKDNLRRKFRAIQELPSKPFYESNIEIYSSGLNEYWEIVGVGMNAIKTGFNNSLLTANKPGRLN